jgi:hypothetical protein
MIPIFTTTEPHGMFDDRGDALWKPKMDSPDRWWNKKYLYQVYLHGKAQDELGFDLAVLVDGRMPDTQGKYTCYIHDKEGYLYLWLSPWTVKTIGSNVKKEQLKGLVVYASDLEAQQYAFKCMTERRAVI